MSDFSGDFDAEVDEGTNLRWRVRARRMEGEEREALAMPVREEVDQLSAFQQLAEAPADDLGDAGAGKALLHHRLRIGEGERTGNRYFDRLVAAHEGPIVGPASTGIDEQLGSGGSSFPEDALACHTVSHNAAMRPSGSAPPSV
jgi:hypothetical protein